MRHGLLQMIFETERCCRVGPPGTSQIGGSQLQCKIVSLARLASLAEPAANSCSSLVQQRQNAQLLILIGFEDLAALLSYNYNYSLLTTDAHEMKHKWLEPSICKSSACKTARL